MRHAVLFGLVIPLLALSAALADEPPSAEIAEGLAALASQKTDYEGMLRDARTETAAGYFLDQLNRLEHDRRVLVQASAEAPDEHALLTPAALTERVDLWIRTRIRERIREYPKEHDLAITEPTSWTRRELPEEFFVWLGEWLGGKQPLSPEAARKAWEERPRHGWLSASYGSGSFIVRPPTVKEPPETREIRRRAAEAGDGSRLRIPKPPTRDQWWERASITQRTSWVLAYFVEHSELFEVGEGESSPCPMCKGHGLIAKTLQTGVPLSYLCTRCAGARHDTVVRFR